MFDKTFLHQIHIFMFLPPVEWELKSFRTPEGLGLGWGKNSTCHEPWQCYLCYLFVVLLP